MTTSTDLKNIFAMARPLIEQWLDVAEQIAALRDVATDKGLDWSQIKALLKARVQDDRDGTGEGKRVAKIIDKAECASAYADMLGLFNVNENNFSTPAGSPSPTGADTGAGEVRPYAEPAPGVPHDPVTGEVVEMRGRAA